MSKSTSPDWKLRLNSILDNAKEEVVGRSSKTASAPPEPTGLLKQAGDVVSALKLVTGQTDQMTLADILRKEGAAGKSPGVVETSTRGTQAEAPRSGSGSVKASPGPGAARPTESEAGTKGASLFDIIQQGREAAEKSAGKGGPSELEANDASGKTPSGLSKLVGSSEAVVGTTKRTALAQTRPSLQSLFANANDSANEGAARAAFPAAVGKGGLKIASDLEKARAFQKQAVSREEFNALMQEPQSGPGRFFHGLGVGFSTPEYQQHLMDTGEFGMPGLGNLVKRQATGVGVGGLLGAAGGALADHVSGGGQPLQAAMLGGGLGASIGSIGALAAANIAQARAQQEATDRALGEKGFNIEYKDRSFPGATTLLGQRRVSTPPAAQPAAQEHTASATPRQIAIAAQRALATA